MVLHVLQFVAHFKPSCDSVPHVRRLSFLTANANANALSHIWTTWNQILMLNSENLEQSENLVWCGVVLEVVWCQRWCGVGTDWVRVRSCHVLSFTLGVALGVTLTLVVTLTWPTPHNYPYHTILDQTTPHNLLPCTTSPHHIRSHYLPHHTISPTNPHHTTPILRDRSKVLHNFKK